MRPAAGGFQSYPTILYLDRLKQSTISSHTHKSSSSFHHHVFCTTRSARNNTHPHNHQDVRIVYLRVSLCYCAKTLQEKTSSKWPSLFTPRISPTQPTLVPQTTTDLEQTKSPSVQRCPSLSCTRSRSYISCPLRLTPSSRFQLSQASHIRLTSRVSDLAVDISI